MASNFGIGVGAFMEGMNSGITAGQRIREIRDNNNARDITSQAGETARAKRQADIGMGIKRGAVDSPEGPVPTYEVDGRQFNDEQAALAESEKKVGSLQDYYFKEVMPQLQQHYMDIGQPDKSFAIGKAIEDEQFQKGAKSWAKATAAFMSGDEKGFLKNYVEAYNNRGYDDDGMTAKGIEPLKDESGNTLGYKVTLADRDGKETVQEFTGDDIGRQSLMYMAPAEVLKRNLSMYDAAQTAQAEIAKEDRKFARDVQLEGLKQGYGIQRDNNKSLLNTAEKAAEVRMGTNNTAKTTSDTDLRKQIYLQLRKEGQKIAENNKYMGRSDPVFNDLPLEEQERVVEEQLKMLKGGNSKQPQTTPARAVNYGSKNMPGMIQQGNIDLNSRPIVKNPDGSISTVRSISVNFDGKEYLIPTVSDDGKSVLSNEDAIKQFKRTGKHLGVFSNPKDASAYAESLHNEQAAQYSATPVQSGVPAPVMRY